MFETFLDLIDDMFDMCLYVWPISAALLVNLLLALLLNNPFKAEVRSRTLFSLLLFLIPFMVVLVGSFSGTFSFSIFAVAVALGQITMSIYFIRINKGFRWSVLSIAACHIYLTFGAWLVSAWHISGD